MTVKDRYEGFQTLCENLNKYGCHFLVLCTIIEEFNKEPLDLIYAVRISMSKGWMDSNFWVKDALAILKFFTGYIWTREQVTTLPIKIKDNQYTECNWYNPATEKEHFTRRGINTLTDSFTVRYGKIRYYYIYTCTGKR